MPDLSRLADTLSQSGLSEFIASFDPLRPRQVEWFKNRERAPARIRPLLDLFLFNQEVEIKELPGELHGVLQDFVGHGIADITDGATVQLKHDLILLPVLGRWLFCNPPGSESKFYFGDDSVALMLRAMPKEGGDALDLCTGPGLQALHCAGFARHVTAIEADKEIADLARVNVLVNKLSKRIEILQGDLFGPVGGKRFDTVVANPPLLPYPSGLPSLSVGHGGHDGMQVTVRILEGLPAAMATGGSAHIITTCLTNSANDHVHDLATELAKSCELDLHITVLSMHSLKGDSPYLDAIVQTVAATTSTDVTTV